MNATYEAERARAFDALLARLATRPGLARVAATELDAVVAAEPLLAVLLTGEPAKSPESWDVCVVLPELLGACPGMRAVVLDPVESAAAAPRFGADRFPTLVVLRGGEYTGCIEGMADWAPFCAELARLAAAPARRPPVAATVSRPAAVPPQEHSA